VDAGQGAAVSISGDASARMLVNAAPATVGLSAVDFSPGVFDVGLSRIACDGTVGLTTASFAPNAHVSTTLRAGDQLQLCVDSPVLGSSRSVTVTMGDVKYSWVVQSGPEVGFGGFAVPAGTPVFSGTLSIPAGMPPTVATISGDPSARLVHNLTGGQVGLDTVTLSAGVVTVGLDTMGCDLRAGLDSLGASATTVNVAPGDTLIMCADAGAPDESRTITLTLGDVRYSWSVAARPAGWQCPTQVSYDGRSYRALQIGTQCWFAENLDVGSMLPSQSTPPSDPGAVEKWCLGNSPANCAAYGGLYSWTEAMAGSTTEGAQGICPAGWRIPSDLDWQVLELQLFEMTVNQLATDGGKGGQGAFDALVTGGFTGFDAVNSGHLSSFYNYSGPYYWTSTARDGVAASRMRWLSFQGPSNGIIRSFNPHGYGKSVRCLQ
jgi:uncharacterized protein (TIGR02145 family)